MEELLLGIYSSMLLLQSRENNKCCALTCKGRNSSICKNISEVFEGIALILVIL